MKRNLVCRMMAWALVSVMVFGTAACGSTDGNPSSDQGEYSSNDDKGASDSGSEEKGSEEPQTPEVDMTPLSITVALTSSNEHVEPNAAYDRLVKEINEYTQMDITWVWMNSTAYYDRLDLDIISGNVEDVVIARDDATFIRAVKENLFWDLTDYIDDYDNLRTIPEAVRMSASYNGRIYGIPRSRTIARHGFGYRVDWLENLGLEEPTDWQSFKDMLYAFTYNDPDNNGINDTVGLYLDSWTGAWDIMMTWFGVPNTWGLDENGDLIHKSQTPEYKTALAAFRELYALGVINDGSISGIPHFMDVAAGKVVTEGLDTSQGGCGVQVLDELRKVQTYFEGEGLTTEDELMFTLAGYVDTGLGALCYPTSGMNNMLAISTTNIKTEAQLKRVLQFLNDLNDGVCMNLLEYGWENETYYVDENGYAVDYDTETKEANGVPSGHNTGFQNVLAYFTAEENARPVTRAPYTSKIRLLEQQLYDDDLAYCVYNYGAGYVSETYSNHGSDLDSMLENTQLQYIIGEIDDAALEAALEQWLTAGGEQVTKEMNELYHAAGN